MNLDLDQLEAVAKDAAVSPASYIFDPQEVLALIARVRELETDRDEWKAQHENLLEVKRQDIGALSSKVIALQQANKRWQELQPLRKAATVILNNAIKYKKIIKPKLCQAHDCTETKVEGHHPDYGHPLSVVWLCNKHHR